MLGTLNLMEDRFNFCSWNLDEAVLVGALSPVHDREQPVLSID